MAPAAIDAAKSRHDLVIVVLQLDIANFVATFRAALFAPGTLAAKPDADQDAALLHSALNNLTATDRTGIIVGRLAIFQWVGLGALNSGALRQSRLDQATGGDKRAAGGADIEVDMRRHHVQVPTLQKPVQVDPDPGGHGPVYHGALLFQKGQVGAAQGVDPLTLTFLKQGRVLNMRERNAGAEAKRRQKRFRIQAVTSQNLPAEPFIAGVNPPDSVPRGRKGQVAG